VWAHDLVDPFELLAEDDAVEEEQGAAGLVLGDGAHAATHREVAQEGDDFR